MRLLGFAIGLAVGAAFKLVIELGYVWTAYLLKKATGRATVWAQLVASTVAGVVAWASLLLPLLPLSLIEDRRAYMAASAWGIFVGYAIQRLRELRES